MTKANDIIIASRRQLGVLAEEEPLEAVDQAADFTTLTLMLNNWVLTSVITSFTCASVTADVLLTFADATTLQDELGQALAANLALEVAAAIGRPVPNITGFNAQQGFDAILRKQNIASLDDSTYDPSISYMPSQRLARIPTDLS